MGIRRVQPDTPGGQGKEVEIHSTKDIPSEHVVKTVGGNQVKGVTILDKNTKPNE